MLWLSLLWASGGVAAVVDPSLGSITATLTWSPRYAATLTAVPRYDATLTAVPRYDATITHHTD